MVCRNTRRHDRESRTLLLVACLSFVPLAHGVGRHGPQRAPVPAAPVRIVLVGDSTVTDTDGWGRGFRRFVNERAICINAAANGRSSRSFLDEGRWQAALAQKGDYYLIQFGHNDEPGKGPDRETDPNTSYTDFMSRYVDDVRAIGATPVLVTSLTRRQFSADGRIVSTLVPYVEAVKRLAARKDVPLVDLHARSIAFCEHLGARALEELSTRKENGEIDTTHLNQQGSIAFARFVVDDLRRVVPALAPVLRDRLDAAPPPDAIVAADGSGQYTSIQQAIDAVPQNTRPDRRWTILVKPGTYRELVYVQREKRFVTLVGEDPVRTVITYDLNATMKGRDDKPIGTFRTPTAVVDADDFTAENLTFENAAGPVGQALAVRVDGDRVVFRNCRFLGWQDTLFLNRGRQYIEDSLVAGHVDFIFGGATAFFERVRIHARRDGYITAASTPLDQPYGFVFAHARITGEDGVKTYLGRPWRDFAQVAFVDSVMSDVVQPSGWHNWDRPERERTSRFSESGTSGPGAAPAGRVAWARPLSKADAAKLTADVVLRGSDQWDPRSVPEHPCPVRAVDAPLLAVSRVPPPAFRTESQRGEPDAGSRKPEARTDGGTR